ncbi:YhjD/YihY/BrkB family envelope integrity protein [Dermatobacter hominis]|uniref:YhjD/YihY/BrkB family envelope integrity protein n=1 Tax=Dermatobacter hominis TaxID=2884263 RepID=UPI001D0F8AC0|nr:YhjD/YihY/BrkB family envelope integrity protein [Dermatobacter hominis]UDY35385.1 YihY/virulence factor BrkB family protein [Dermatobacter hominis]
MSEQPDGKGAVPAPDAAGAGASDASAPDGTDGSGGPRRVQRTKDRIDGTRERVGIVVERVVAARPDTPLIDTGFELYERDSRIAGGMLAGAIAFRLFLLVVPLLLILVAGLGFLHESESERGASDQLGFSQALVDTMSTVGANAARGRWITLWVGLVATVFAVRTLIKSLRIVHNLAWGTSRKPSANRPLDVLVGVGVVALVIAMMAAAQWARARTPGGGILASVVIGVVATGIYLVVELLLPRAEGTSWLGLVPGAVLVGAGTQALHAATVFYFAGRVSRMSETYGPLGVAIVVLLWLYILGRLIVGAAVLNAGLTDRRTRGVATWSPIDMSLFRGR